MFSGGRKGCIGEEWVKKWTKLGLKIRNTKSINLLTNNVPHHIENDGRHWLLMG